MNEPNWRAWKWLKLRGMEFSCLFFWSLAILYFKHELPLDFQMVFLAILPPFIYFLSFIYAAITIGIRVPFKFTKIYDLRLMKASINAAVHIVYGLILYRWFTAMPSDAYFTQEIIDYYMLDWAWLAGILFNFVTAYYIYRPDLQKND